MEGAGKGQLKRDWEWRRHGKGSWRGIGNIGGREREIGTWLEIWEAVKGQLVRG